MPSKFQFITELYANTLHELTHTAESWTGFLRTACYNYKCPFDEQVLIYAQRPDATAVLELDKWNKQFGRWINRGAHGIAVLSDENGMGKLKYYFDVSDTHVSSYARPLPIWKMDLLYENEVIEVLENTFGELKEKETLVKAVFSASRNAAADNVPDYLYDLKNCVKDSFLEELDDLNLEVRYRQLIETSVAYMLLTRLSIKADEYITREDFGNLYDFNTITTINSLGIATSDIAEMGLREISRTIMSLSKEQFFENVDKLPYDNAKEKPKADDERSRNDGSNLQNRERMPNTQPSDAPTAGSTPGQIRSAAPTVSDEAPESALYEPQDECKADGAFGGDRKSGDGDDRADHPQNGAERRRDGTSEADRPDEMDRAHEQLPAFSGGNSPERPDIQLNFLDGAGENESDSASFLNEQLIQAIVLDDQGRTSTSQEIFSYFQNNKDRTERCVFLKNAYKDTDTELLIENARIGYKKQEDGLLMWEGTYLSRTSESVFSWEVITDLTESLITRGEYKIQLGLQTMPDIVEQLTLFGMGENTPSYECVNSEADLPLFSEHEIPQAVISTPVLRTKVQNQSFSPLDYNGTNYHIYDDQLGAGSPKEKFRRNIEAIETLNRIEQSGLPATPVEQKVLSRYVGWGGLSEYFDENKTAWASEYKTLRNVLSDEEYVLARESSLTAFFTPPVVIRSIYKVIENMGFAQGNILEPSCGIGNYFGSLPDSMAESKLYGIELDSISGRLAKQLYQKASITIQGFEKADIPDSFFDVVIGNVPFGQFKVADKRYDKNNFLVHDYFFAKALDKVRSGGVIAFITSKGTLDKENPSVRKYIAQRADLLGAIRLPNTAFRANAGTEVTSDIIFLQKRDRLIDIEPDWVHLGTDENGITINQYFIDNPGMLMGEMKMVSGPFGPESACVPYEEQRLAEMLSDAVQNIHGKISDYERDEDIGTEDKAIPADPTVRNFSYTLVDDELYYRENSCMYPVDVAKTADNRIRGMISLRDCVRTLIELQTEDYPDETITAQQRTLNGLYDSFTDKYGLINSRGNSMAFSEDSSYFLLCSLEIVDEDGNLERKADLFTKRTIRSHRPAEKVDTASEALAVSIGEKARVDMEYMGRLTGKSEEELYADLKGVVFLNPMFGDGSSAEEKYLPADEYLSGNVRQKLDLAKRSAEANPEDYTVNVEALTQVQPVDLTASEISVRLGATWLPPEIPQQFIYELLGTPRWAQYSLKVHYSKLTGEWRIEGKNQDRGNVKAYSTYGTKRISAYAIIEESLNLKDVRIMDYMEDDDGKKSAVLNKKETAIAQAKQEIIRSEFTEWVWRDPERREKLCSRYNSIFNSNRPREYDGSHITLSAMNPEITLRTHQINAIAHILYGGNTLLAHTVGAGKTFEMVAAAMESKRLGLCQKSLFVVPNHLTEQWASEFLQLYPSANILVATKKDFETNNRKKFCGRIATGEYDAVIIGHSQFEKIPMSIERQRAILEQQVEEILMGISEAKNDRAENFTIKQMEKTRKGLQQKLDKLNDQSRKDDVVTFEELGVDRLFVDESHAFKNLFLYTKMRNVGGIAQTEAQKSSDLFMKCRYLDEITGGRGIIFATGTPISNSMVELYTIQRYLQMSELKEQELQHFDAWASNYGETVTAIELSPEGTGYRAKTRFAKFYNLPELMAMFKNVADIQTADMLNLPVPEAVYHNLALKPTEYQKDMVVALADRAEKVRNREVDSSVDNMLLITNDGRKLALDQRLMNPMLPDDPNSKTSACAQKVYEIWQLTAPRHSAQMIFCDLSTPHYDGSFNVYDDIKGKLVSMGIPEAEIAFIHDAKTEIQKKEMFAKVRNGQIRVLMGSTQRMGAGTNAQNKLIALHHVDCPWRPSDLQQREGRIIRQGNENPTVEIYSYVTEQTFDAYLYQLVESKQKFISQIMTSKSPVRSAEDVDETALSYAEIKALATGNPMIKEKMDLDIEVSKLKLLKSSHLSQKYALEDQIIKQFPRQIAESTEHNAGYAADQKTVAENTYPNEDGFSPMVLMGTTYIEKKVAGSELLVICHNMLTPDATVIGEYRGLTLELSYDSFSKEYRLAMIGRIRYTVSLGTDIYGNIQRMDNALETLPVKEKACREHLEELYKQLETAKAEVEKPFAKEAELKAKTARLDELNALLNIDSKEREDVEKQDKSRVKEFER